MKNSTFALIVILVGAFFDLIIPIIPLFAVLMVVACFSKPVRNYVIDVLKARDEE